MRKWKRLFYYLIINVFVSACTVVTVLTIWEYTHPQMPLLSQFIPIAQITPLSPRALFPGFETQEMTSTPSPTPTEVTEELSNLTLTDIPQSEIEYKVQAGDTLGAIAVKFDITVAEIMAVNEIVNPDQLEVGRVLIIRRPLVSIPTHTPLPTNEAETAIPLTPATSTPPPLTGETQVIIDGVFGTGDLDSERVFLIRVGPGEISLANWQLVTESGETFTFPQITLYESGALYVYTKAGLNSAVAAYWELDHPVWASGETIILRDEQGQIHTSFQIP
jgi:LysM repeat protein